MRIMKVDQQRVAKIIREIRTDLGYSMAQFGELISNSPKTTVNNWERGINLPKEDKLKKIALLGKTTVEELLYGTPEEVIIIIMKKNFSLPVRKIDVNKILGILKSRKICPYDELKVIELIQTMLDTSEINAEQYLNYVPIPGSPNMYLAVPVSQLSDREEAPAYYAYVSPENSALHLLPYIFVPRGNERYFQVPLLEKKEEYSFVTNQFSKLGLILENTEIIFYGRNKKDNKPELFYFEYDKQKDGFFLQRKKVRRNLVNYFYQEISESE